ncbi:MAG: hypothetical protein LBK59_05040 [Bifidobacteriaceae bacterium]|nr:hypothetical protein [Bifidobacteriaceae bacterium]
MPERIAEFDAFGPWVLPVRDADDVPPLFRPLVDVTDARLAVKVPRPIERRTADPTMDLYDSLIVVRGDGVEILARTPGVGDGTARVWLPARDILAVEDDTDLLHGCLRLHAADGAVEIPYNAVSSDVMMALIHEVRTYWRVPAAGGAKSSLVPVDALGPAEVGVANRFRWLQAHDPSVHPALLRPRRRATREGGAPRRLLDRVLPRFVNGLVIGTTGSELVVVRRRRGGVEPHRGPEYSLAITVVPFGRGVRVEAARTPGWVCLHDLRLAPTAVKLLAADGDGTGAVIGALLSPDRSASQPA